MKKIRQTYNYKGDAPDGRMVCPNWDMPEVNCKSNGRGRTCAGKVITLGIDYILAPELIQAGVNVLVMGTAYFRAEDPAAVVRRIKELS